MTLKHDPVQRPGPDTSADPHAALPEDVAGALLFDVRRAPIYHDAPDVIPGSTWRDPALVDEWIDEVPIGRTVIVYCVHGHEVSQGTALRLRDAGRDARFLRGGLEAWRSCGNPTERRTPD